MTDSSGALPKMYGRSLGFSFSSSRRPSDFIYQTTSSLGKYSLSTSSSATGSGGRMSGTYVNDGSRILDTMASPDWMASRDATAFEKAPLEPRQQPAQ
eukprot:IDg22742t1